MRASASSIVAKKKGRPLRPPLLRQAFSFCRKWLEVDPQAKLYRARGVRLHRSRDQFATNAAQRTPISRIPKHIVRIAQNRMIKDVGKVSVELQMDALCDHDVLPNAQVHVPVHLAAQNPGATTVTLVNA